MMMMSRACTPCAHTGLAICARNVCNPGFFFSKGVCDPLVASQTASMNCGAFLDGLLSPDEKPGLHFPPHGNVWKRTGHRPMVGSGAAGPSKSRGHGPLVDGDLDKSNWSRPDDVGAATWTLSVAYSILLCGIALYEKFSSSRWVSEEERACSNFPLVACTHAYILHVNVDWEIVLKFLILRCMLTWCKTFCYSTDFI